MKVIYTLLSFFLIVSLYGQRGYTEEQSDIKDSQTKQFNLIKIGASVQAEPFSSYTYDYDDYYYYNNYGYYDGANWMVFASYEHIWEFRNKTAVSIEPMLGASLRKRLKGFMGGAEFKFYWANTGNWRMGVALNTAYTYSHNEIHRWVNMGSYQQLKEISVHYNIFSFNSALIPFQFKIKNSPFIIESLFSFMGFNVITENMENYRTEYDYNDHRRYSEIYPFFLKLELKVGIMLP